MGFVKDLRNFDASFFGAHPKLAERTDPIVRTLLETSVEAVIDAGKKSFSQKLDPYEQRNPNFFFNDAPLSADFTLSSLVMPAKKGHFRIIFLLISNFKANNI